MLYDLLHAVDVMSFISVVVSGCLEYRTRFNFLRSMSYTFADQEFSRFSCFFAVCELQTHCPSGRNFCRMNLLRMATDLQKMQ